MKKTIIIIVAITIALIVTSCGHNIASQSKGIGIDVSWNGSNYVPNVRLGYWDDTTAVVRGNATVSASTASGGGLVGGQGGTSQTIQIATGTQVNEGYIKDILVDENIDTSAKIEFIRMLDRLAMPSTDSSANKTTSAESKIIKTSSPAPTPVVIDDEEQSKEEEGTNPGGVFAFEKLTIEKNKKLTIPANIITKAGLAGTVKILSTENMSVFCVVSEDFKYDENTFELFKEMQIGEDGSIQFGIGKLLDVKADDTVGVDIYSKQLIIYKIEQEPVVATKAAGTGSASSMIVEAKADTAPKAVPAAEQIENK